VLSVRRRAEELAAKEEDGENEEDDDDDVDEDGLENAACTAALNKSHQRMTRDDPKRCCLLCTQLTRTCCIISELSKNKSK